MHLLDLFKRNNDGSFRVNGPFFDPTIQINPCHFLPLCGSIGAGYFTKLYLVKKHITWQALKLKKKVSTYLESLTSP